MNTPKLIATFLVVFAITSYADDAATLAATINGYTGGTGNLSASYSGNTVTVTGTKTNPTEGLTLDIDDGVSVIWKSIAYRNDY
jgi:hypothetical protein